ncbi:MAG: hypothetical protein KatS3mg129_0398 [Leptospiraceae bacterium]|nr:MAG: hypothetical protein KatS3mg129_0398 [Leptospiraceae bacterium]
MNNIEIIYVEEIDENQQKKDKIITTNPGKTILEISLENHIPHAHACGGNAKCSTCRVMIISGMENLSEPSIIENHLAQKKGFGRNIRLACQTKSLWKYKNKTSCKR